MDYGEFIRSKEFSAQGAGFECGSLNQSLKDYQSDILPVWPNAAVERFKRETAQVAMDL